MLVQKAAQSLYSCVTMACVRKRIGLGHLLGLVADDLVAFLDRADAADVEADAGVELERVAAGGDFSQTWAFQ
jgi:hypothetical protein